MTPVQPQRPNEIYERLHTAAEQIAQIEPFQVALRPSDDDAQTLAQVLELVALSKDAPRMAQARIMSQELVRQAQAALAEAEEARRQAEEIERLSKQL